MMSQTRKARTRTLIQLGGLIEKSGLITALGIEIGQDLQKDTEVFSKVAILMALFHENSEFLNVVRPQDLEHWINRGRELLRSDKTHESV